jgi:very-long-chain ceramide synthase
VAPYYFTFVLVWVYMRHFLNLKIIWSLFTEFKTIGPYELDWAGGQFKCELAFWITLILLSSLQALNIFWLFYIIRIAYQFLRYDQLEDERSDAEEETESEAGAGGVSKTKEGKKNNGLAVASNSGRR